MKLKQNSILIIIGEGQERKKLEKLIEEKNLKEKIFLIGEIKDASKYLKGFDLFILPSRYEGLSITLIEALFAKIPVLASEVGGNKEVVGKDCIFKSKKEFLEKFKVSKVPLVAKNLEIEKTVINYLNLYQQLWNTFF